MKGGGLSVKMKAGKIGLLLVFSIILPVFVSCPSAEGPFELPWHIPPERTVSKQELGDLDPADPRFLANSGVRVALEISGGQDPRIALRYRLDVGGLGPQGPLFFDYVVLSAARMVKTGSIETGFQFTLDTSDLDYILNNRRTLIAPLQRQGVKVLLQVVNCRERSGGFTFANLPERLRFDFAITVNSVLRLYGLDGLEFVDKYGDNPEQDLFAYPVITGRATHYDWLFDDFPDYNPRRSGNRINISNVRIPYDLRLNPSWQSINWDNLRDDLTDTERMYYFWMRGGYAYGILMSYFRGLLPWQNPQQVLHTVIGPWHTHPILVREVGFAGGRTDMRDIMNPDLFNYFSWRNSFMSSWINDARQWPLLSFITDHVNYFVSGNLAPAFGWKHDDPSQCTDLCRSPEGCTGTGWPIMDFVRNNEYSPGILDLGQINNNQIEIFSLRFASGNRLIPVFDDTGAFSGEFVENTEAHSAGNPFTLLYYTNLTGPGPEVAERLSITSRIVHGGRNTGSLGLESLRKDGPAVIYISGVKSSAEMTLYN